MTQKQQICACMVGSDKVAECLRDWDTLGVRSTYNLFRGPWKQPPEKANLNTNLQGHTMPTALPKGNVRGAIPKVIYMLWIQGWEHAPSWNKICRQTWESLNPEYTLHALDLEGAERLSNRQAWVSDAAFNIMEMPSKSDVLRVLILAGTFTCNQIESVCLCTACTHPYACAHNMHWQSYDSIVPCILQGV